MIQWRLSHGVKLPTTILNTHRTPRFRHCITGIHIDLCSSSQGHHRYPAGYHLESRPNRPNLEEWLQNQLQSTRSSAPKMNSFMRPAVQKDIELVQPPTESISKIAFSPTQDILAVGSWDNNVSESRPPHRLLAKRVELSPLAQKPQLEQLGLRSYADFRSDSTTSTRKGNRNQKRCTLMMRRFWTCAGQL